MPLKPGISKETIGQNIHEFRGGKTYARTKKKFGAQVARRQAIAASLAQARKSGANIPKKKGS